MKLTITQQFQDFMLHQGVSLAQLLEKAGIPNLLWQEELRLDEQQYYDLLMAFDSYLTSEQLLAFSDVKNIQMFMPPLFAALSATTGMEALERFITYKKIIGPINIEKHCEEDRVSVSFSYIYPVQKLPRFALLNEQLLLTSLIRTGTHQPIQPLIVKGPYKLDKLLQDYYGSPVEVSDENVIVFKLSDLNTQFLTQNNVMWEYIEPELKNQLNKLKHQRSFLDNVQAMLMQVIPSGKFSLEDVARMMGMGGRTLQRYLKEEGTSFNYQLKKAQKSLALSFVKNNHLTSEDITYLLGYSEVSSFKRAFKRWTGENFSDYKNK